MAHAHGLDKPSRGKRILAWAMAFLALLVLVLVLGIDTLELARHTGMLSSAGEEAADLRLGLSPKQVKTILGEPDRLEIADDGKALASLTWIRPSRTEIHVVFERGGVSRAEVVDGAEKGRRIDVPLRRGTP